MLTPDDHLSKTTCTIFQIDKDRDGIADVDELCAKDLAARRLMVLTKSVDPNKVITAIEGLTIASVAILATLKVRFAKAITLGTTIGKVLEQIFSPFTSQLLDYALPDKDYDKWIPVINKYVFRYIGVSMSWVLMRMVTAVFAALKGSELFLTGLVAYLVRFGYIDKDYLSKGHFVFVVSWAALALFGTYIQISSRFSLPFPLNLLFLPLTVLEQVIIFAVGASAD